MPNKSTSRNVRFAMTMSHQFLTPIGKDPNHEMLRRAVDLSTSDGFRRKRQAFYSWQEGVIEENISDEKAIEEMEQQLKALNEATQHAFGDTMAPALRRGQELRLEPGSLGPRRARPRCAALG